MRGKKPPKHINKRSHGLQTLFTREASLSNVVRPAHPWLRSPKKLRSDASFLIYDRFHSFLLRSKIESVYNWLIVGAVVLRTLEHLSPKRKTSSDSDEFVSLGGPLLSVMLGCLLADFRSVKGRHFKFLGLRLPDPLQIGGLGISYEQREHIMVAEDVMLHAGEICVE